jgi:hypothetical protein
MLTDENLIEVHCQCSMKTIILSSYRGTVDKLTKQELNMQIIFNISRQATCDQGLMSKYSTTMYIAIVLKNVQMLLLLLFYISIRPLQPHENLSIICI